MRHFLLLAVLAASFSRPLTAQRLGPAADRPSLRDVADTNDAQAYYDFGLARMENDPEVASRAFYWAARINPAWGEALYARRASLIRADRRLLANYFDGRRNDSPEARRLDSLQFRALMWSPFLYRRLDRSMLVAYIREDVTRRSRTNGASDPPSAEMDYYIEQYLRSAGPRMKGWLAYGSGDFRSALEYYDSALRGARDKANLRMERARIFGMRGQADSAIAQMRLALEELRKQDQKDLVVFYDSKALAEYSIAVLLEGAGNVDGAREAYGQALQEDLSYYPAHMRLGLLALGKGDTATAVSEVALASQLAADEPHVRYVHGFVLSELARYTEAVDELKRAIALEPYYALPYLRLAQVCERLDKGPEALSAYEGFLARASRHDVQRAYATGRATMIKEILAGPPTP